MLGGSVEGARLVLLVTRVMREGEAGEESPGGILCTSSAGFERPMPSPAAVVESVSVTLEIFFVAVDCGTDALGWCMGKSAAMFLVCSALSALASAGS